MSSSRGARRRRAEAVTPYEPQPSLQEFDWTGLVQGHFFESMLVGIVGTVVALVTIQREGVIFHQLVIIDPFLSALCVLLAFTRVWKTVREEHETCPIWDSVTAENDDNAAILDRVFEVPYLFSILLLPLAAVAPQLFMFILFVFYASDNFYNAGLALGDQANSSPGEQSYRQALWTAIKRITWLKTDGAEGDSRDRMVEYFRRRSHYDSRLMGILLLTIVAVTVLRGIGWFEAAWLSATMVLTSILMFELFIEPRRNEGMVFVPESEGALRVISIETVRTRASAADIGDELTAIHEEAFEAAEQHYSMDHMLAQIESDDSIFRVVSLHGHAVGYLYLELVERSETAFLWYFAIASEHRSGGLGGMAITDTLELLRRDHQTLRYVFFEVHKPAADEDYYGGHDDSRRIRFYRRLGAYWIRGVDYRIPAANDDSRAVSIEYDPMFFVLRGALHEPEVRQRIAMMAEDNFEDDPKDERWTSLKESLTSATILAPTDPVAHDAAD